MAKINKNTFKFEIETNSFATTNITTTMTVDSAITINDIANGNIQLSIDNTRKATRMPSAT